LRRIRGHVDTGHRSAGVSSALRLSLSFRPQARARSERVDVCKGESKVAVEGKGKIAIAVVYPGDFPVTTTPAMRNAVGAALAKAEKGMIVPAKDVEWAKRLVDNKKWTEKSAACGYSPSLVAVLGQKHKNLSTATPRCRAPTTRPATPRLRAARRSPSGGRATPRRCRVP
jgi:hypothetical protein